MADLPALYPFRTEPVYRYYIWGGRRLAPMLGKPAGPDGTLAESWEVGDDARVAEGAWSGRTLREVDEATGGGVGGNAPHYANAWLPLLIKLSDSAQDLSVQIHPNDEQALRDDPGRGYPGKTEMYLIIAAEPGAGVYWGLRPGVTPEALRSACLAGKGVPELLNFVPVKAGDALYSPPGVVHAIGKGVVYCEVQQNSDITYRLYDWGRVDPSGKPRQLHLEQGLAVLDLGRQRSKPIEPLVIPQSQSGVRRTMLCACRYFAVELIEFTGARDGAVPGEGAPGTGYHATAGEGSARTAHPATAGESLRGMAHSTTAGESSAGTVHPAAAGGPSTAAGIGSHADLRRTRPTMRAVIVLEGEVRVAGGAQIARAGRGQSVVVPAALAESSLTATGPARVLLAYEPDLAADVVQPLRAAGYTVEGIEQLGDVS